MSGAGARKAVDGVIVGVGMEVDGSTVEGGGSMREVEEGGGR